MRVLLAGGAGFLGSHLCDRLLADGHEVTCVDSFLTGRPSNVGHLLGHAGFRLVEHDVTEPLELAGPLDAVMSFASPASPLDYSKYPIETLKAGSHGTLNLLELAREHGARFLLASTSEVYGDPKVHPQHESYWGHVNPIGPRSMYDEAKRFAEALTVAYRRRHDVDAAIVRIFNTYGPRMRTDDGRAIPAFVSQALRGEPVTVAGDGSQTRSVCYVDDLVDGIVRLLYSNLPGPVNIGNPHEMSILEIARLAVEMVGTQVPVAFVPLPGDDPQVRRPDITLAREQLGWEPRVDVRDGMARTIEWFAAELATEPVGPPAAGAPSGLAEPASGRPATVPALTVPAPAVEVPEQPTDDAARLARP